jgi:nitrogen regulatory protein P-II 1
VLGEAFEPMLKFEVACRDENAEQLVEAVRKAATTGHAGDGRIFVVTVEEAVAISSGKRGEGVLSL